MAYDLIKLQNQLIRDEGLKLMPYRDSLGHLTIGVGHLIVRGEKFGTSISNSDALSLLELDIKVAERRLNQIFPQWRELDEVRQMAFLNLTFNLGFRLANFKRFLQAASKGNWGLAADHLMDSKWYKQVHLRGPRVVHAIRTGTEWTGV